MPYTAKQKEATYKWREAHPEKFKEQQKRDFRKYYEKNRLVVLARVKAYQEQKKQQKISV